MSNPSPVFDAKDLQVIRGGALILNVPALTVAEGERFFIIGPNGAGKSTLLQVLSALVRPSRGEIFFKGRKIGSDLPVLEYRRRLAMVLQEPLLFNTTVYNNVASGLKIRSMKRDQIGPIVAKTLERFKIFHLKDRSARTLSGGEARRVSIARAFATDPDVLLLDEPFSALDPIIRETLIEDLDHVLRETRITTIFVTHDRTEAFRLADRIGIMKGGEILQTGPPEEVMNNPVNEFAASFIGIENILEGEVTSRCQGTIVASVSGQRIEATGDMEPGIQALFCIRPDQVSISEIASSDGPGDINRFPATIEKITPMGFYRRVQLNCGFRLAAYAANHSISPSCIQEGSRVLAFFEISAVHVLPREKQRFSDNSSYPSS
ncbi:MAG: hypothetical protein A2V65_07295 [Deltaproteobacteria bacterium RBG_13_49_15]|nr:MAG: hypothetical protein A2V65_07295 [Deltaproteobacteria bacterium RBG_13_49_15]